ncbi:MAG: EamA family transporter [Thermoplasmata archaeon]|uniref:EamA family transporter n=1 Tax=Candidatus Sysuiplasma superficiale TaxID=2823368 RepID=A0A8J7YUG5_9ARCH|nr:EamA family transporter [Candidatus Sysuiplasma superficiale]MBX8643129.1 EamA family transporter [Candidatus Sysuiplasma superficiale]MCL4346938.1 DMT family transporter [Candidatus Thermoplasmatota archaeon]
MKRRRVYLSGVVYALTGATLWGLSGTASSALFSIYHMPYLSLLTVRMLLSGGLLYLVFRPPLPKSNPALFLVFAFSLMTVQLTYLAAIRYSNAPTATMLQYFFLPVVLVYEIMTHRIAVTRILYIFLALAVIGIFELSTSFPAGGLSIVISLPGLAFGLMSALAAALYTLLSSPMIERYGTVDSVLWGMLAGGAMSVPLGIFPTFGYISAMRSGSFAPVLILVLFVSVFGTMIAFTFFIKSMELISATQASIAATMEPVSAAVSSLVFLGLALTYMQYAGGVLILLSIIAIQKTSAVQRIEMPSAPK